MQQLSHWDPASHLEQSAWLEFWLFLFWCGFLLMQGDWRLVSLLPCSLHVRFRRNSELLTLPWSSSGFWGYLVNDRMYRISLPVSQLFLSKALFSYTFEGQMWQRDGQTQIFYLLVHSLAACNRRRLAKLKSGAGSPSRYRTRSTGAQCWQAHHSIDKFKCTMRNQKWSSWDSGQCSTMGRRHLQQELNPPLHNAWPHQYLK